MDGVTSFLYLGITGGVKTWGECWQVASSCRPWGLGVTLQMAGKHPSLKPVWKMEDGGWGMEWGEVGGGRQGGSEMREITGQEGL